MKDKERKDAGRSMKNDFMMDAVVCRKYGPPEVLRITRVPSPFPKPDEVRIRIHASAVTASDIFIRSARVTPALQIPFRLMMGFTGPRRSVVGFVFSGIVEEAGDKTRRFKPGDEVYGTTGFRLGAYAEYRCMKETDSARHGCLALKPGNLTHEESTAAAYGGLLALQYVEKGRIQPADKVLIYGASGTSGTLAVQYARHLGAIVTGVCGTENVDFVKSLGANEVIDYTRADAPPSGASYDFVLDSVGGMKKSELKKACKKALSPRGKYVSIDDGDLQLSSERLMRLKELIEGGSIKPILGRAYPLEDIVEAHRFVENGHKRGGVAVTIAPSASNRTEHISPGTRSRGF
jgi:NADPH:quinone reductase-like Zn-dependent oxidoreductase